jgi:hypothetical protein
VRAGTRTRCMNACTHRRASRMHEPHA